MLNFSRRRRRLDGLQEIKLIKVTELIKKEHSFV